MNKTANGIFQGDAFYATSIVAEAVVWFLVATTTKNLERRSPL
ncbi:hypothetical protein [Allocoleopsis sp.]